MLDNPPLPATLEFPPALFFGYGTRISKPKYCILTVYTNIDPLALIIEIYTQLDAVFLSDDILANNILT